MSAASKKSEAAEDRQRPDDPIRALVAETFGTFVLTFVAAGGIVVGALNGSTVTYTAATLSVALVVTAIIYTIGGISGSHINPAVTLGFAVRGVFPWRSVPGYWTAQTIGGILAAVVLRLLFGTAGRVGSTIPHHGYLTSLLLETILTFFLVTVVLAVTRGSKLVGTDVAVAVGFIIGAGVLFAAPIGGASMDPARSIGPAFFGGALGSLWVYIVGPLVGALIAVGLIQYLLGAPPAKQSKIAAGIDRSKGDQKLGPPNQ